MKWRPLFLIFLLCFLCSCQHSPKSRLPSSYEGGIDVVFDLDWTLIAQVQSPIGISEEDLLVYEGEYYRLNPGARELLSELSEREGVRISFFSGGGIQRNRAVLSQVKIGESNALELATHVYSRSDLTDLSSQVSSEARFSERYKKDLRLINPDLSRVVMIEDNVNFALNPEQGRNFIWLGQTYENMEKYSTELAMKVNEKYRPTSYAHWLSSRLKLSVVGEILRNLLSTEKEGIDFERMNELVEHSELQNAKWSDFKSRLLRKKWPQSPSNCNEHMELLLSIGK